MIIFMTSNSASMNSGSNSTADFSEMKESLKDGLKGAREQGVKSRRQSVGLAAMAYDEMKEAWADRERILNEAEERGAEVEEDLGDFMKDFDEQVNAMMSELREQGPSMLSGLVNSFANKSENETVKSAAGIFEKFATRFQEKANKYADMSAEKCHDIPISTPPKAASNVAASSVEVSNVAAPEPASAPWASYDDMTAKDIADKVSSMSAAKKAAVRAYEAANKNRVTVMRAASA